MNTKEIKENRNRQNEKLQKKFSVLIDDYHMPKEERNYTLLKQLRIKLGKSKEEFKKIFDLYNHLLGQKNP
jgi:predicted HAD superfamily phosphohydrolase